MKSLALALTIPLALASATPAPLTSPPGQHSNLTHNANHVFNAVHSALRQWGSSLNHNGMSYFLATVPKGTQLYHGTIRGEPVSGMEWLAFEPEHSLLFAGFPGGGRGKGPGRGGPPGEGPPDGDREPPESDPAASLSFSFDNHDQQPLSNHAEPSNSQEEELGGFLHTYRAAYPLRLLYLDGEAAAKSEKGTLDTQDFVLMNFTDDRRGMFRDFERGTQMCDLAATEWGGLIDGILRMEGGFEIILCSFQKSLEVVRITRAKSRSWGPGGQGEGQLFDYYRAITARYHGIGGDRVLLNYDQFVTAFDGKYDIDLFTEVSGRVLPRLTDASAEHLGMIKADIKSLVLGMGAGISLPEHAFDWQGVADMVVGRYADRLKFLVSDSLRTLEELQREVEWTLQMFIDYEKRDAAAEIHRCATQFIPATAPPPSESMSGFAVAHVAHKICATLFSAGEQDSHEAAVREVSELIDWLDWTKWKECGACDPDKICSVPIWPNGAPEDFVTPTCMNTTQAMGRSGYWVGFGNRPRRRPEETEKDAMDL